MEDFVTYEIAVKLKEKGFSEKCLYHYFDNKLVSNTCKSDNDNITTEDLLMSCNYLLSKFDTVGSNIVVSDAPTISQVLKWLREEKKISVQPLSTRGNRWESQITFTDENDKKLVEKFLDGSFWAGRRSKTYEEAALAGIQYVIDNLI